MRANPSVDLVLKQYRSAKNDRAMHSQNRQPIARQSKPSQSLSKSLNKKKVNKSIGPNQRAGLGRAEMLTNGYKSLRTQGLLRATKIPDDIP